MAALVFIWLNAAQMAALVFIWLNAAQCVQHQCLCPLGEPQSPARLQETLQDQQVGLTQDPIKLLPLP